MRRTDVTRVSFGPTSIIGYLLTLAAAIPVVVRGIEEGSAAYAVAGPAKWYAIAMIAFGAITTFIRGMQATAKAHAFGRLEATGATNVAPGPR